MGLLKGVPKRSLPQDKPTPGFCPSISPVFFGMSFAVDQRYLRLAALSSLVYGTLVFFPCYNELITCLAGFVLMCRLLTVPMGAREQVPLMTMMKFWSAL